MSPFRPVPLAPQPAQPPAPPLGRLVLIMERELHPLSRTKLHNLLSRMACQPEPTFVASLAQPAFLGALKLDDSGVFYNADGRAQDLPQTLGLLPWREVWMVCGGQIWRSGPAV